MNVHHTPRLYVEDDLSINHTIILNDDHTHYLKNVLRLKNEDIIRVFNGRSDEFKAILQFIGKKSAHLQIDSVSKILSQPALQTHLFFPLIKKDRMDWLIEKSVELGVTDLHPIITDHVKIRELNDIRLKKQIIEAAEQCERLIIPTLHPLTPLKTALEAERDDIEYIIALERAEGITPIKNIIFKTKNRGFIFGPEGGFSEHEKQWFKDQSMRLVTLGDTILRAETAGLVGLISITS